jgi:hypothetical protein
MQIYNLLAIAALATLVDAHPIGTTPTRPTAKRPSPTPISIARSTAATLPKIQLLVERAEKPACSKYWCRYCQLDMCHKLNELLGWPDCDCHITAPIFERPGLVTEAAALKLWWPKGTSRPGWYDTDHAALPASEIKAINEMWIEEWKDHGINPIRTFPAGPKFVRANNGFL